MNFSEAVGFLKETDKYGIVPGLDSIKRLCSELSDPQNSLKIIHIAGTNGKGSAGTFLNSILSKAGYKTGRYVSPAVMDYLEKIQYDNCNISEEEFAFYTEKVKNAAEKIVSEGFPHPTTFELETALAFCFFADKNCDVVLLEAGMGGKNDATNIISESILSLITSISLEHTRFLGDTIEKIAAEKAGIIKPGGNVVTLTQNPSVIDVIRNVCHEKSAYLKISKIYNISDYRYKDGIQYFSYNDFSDIRLSMLGKFQTENAVLCIDACQVLNNNGFNISDQNIYDGLFEAKWPGRFEVIKNTYPMIIIDGAHNVSAAVRLRESIDIYFSDSRISYIMGTFSDKNFSEIARITAKRADKIFTVCTEGKRGLDAEILSETIRQYNPNVVTAESISDAVDKSLNENTDIIIAFGSLSFMNSIKRYVNGESKT